MCAKYFKVPTLLIVGILAIIALVAITGVTLSIRLNDSKMIRLNEHGPNSMDINREDTDETSDYETNYHPRNIYWKHSSHTEFPQVAEFKSVLNEDRVVSNSSESDETGGIGVDSSSEPTMTTAESTTTSKRVMSLPLQPPDSQSARAGGNVIKLKIVDGNSSAIDYDKRDHVKEVNLFISSYSLSNAYMFYCR